MMQPQAGANPQAAPQDNVQAGMQLEETIAGILDSNPQMKNQIHTMLQEADKQGIFDDLEPQEAQQVMGLLQQIVENPASYPQVYDQLLRSGGNPEDFPPPDTPPEQLADFASTLLVVIYYMGKLGVVGTQAGGSAPSPTGGQVPPGTQGYAFGGMVGGKPVTMQEFNHLGQKNIGLQNLNMANMQAQGNFAPQQAAQTSNAPVSEGAATQALNPAPAGASPQSTKGIDPTGNPFGTTALPGYGTLYEGADLVEPWLAERDLLRDEYAATPEYQGLRGIADVHSTMYGMYGGDPRGSDAAYQKLSYDAAAANQGRGDGSVAARNWHKLNPQRGLGSGLNYLNYTPENLNFTRTLRGREYGGFKSTPADYYRANIGSNRSTPGFQQYGGWMSGGHSIDPWQTNEVRGGGANFHSPTYQNQAVRYGWQDEKSGRLYPVRSQGQLNEYIAGYTNPQEGVDQFRSGKPYWKVGHGEQLRQRPNLYEDSQNLLSGYNTGGVVTPTQNPIQTNTGDDQLIAAKTGEGVLNVDAVNMLGGPAAVNALNYQASGQVPGGQPVGGMRGYAFGGVVSDKPPGAVAGYRNGGMVGEAVTNSQWEWSDQSNKYVPKRKTSKKFSGRVVKAMGFFGGALSKFLGTIISIVGAVVVPGIGASFGALAGAATGALFGAAAGAISTGSLKGALIGGALGGLGGGVSGYFSSGSIGAPAAAVPSSAGTNFAASATPYPNFGPTTGSAAGFNTNLSAAALNATPGLGGGVGGIGAGGLSAATQGGSLLSQPLAGGVGSGLQSFGGVGVPQPSSVISNTGVNQGGGVVGNTGQPQTVGGVLNNAGSKLNNVVGGIVDRITDPKNLAYAGTKLLGSALVEQPDFGADAYQAQGANALNNANSFAAALESQYNKNVPSLQNSATNIALLGADPQAQARLSSNQFKIEDEHRRRQLQDQLSSQNKGPTSSAYIDAMRKQRHDSRLGGVHAYNTGMQRGVQTGVQNLAAAKSLHSEPNYGALGGQYAALGQYGARTKRDEWNARNEAARSMGNLLFPPDPDEEMRRNQQLSMGMTV